MPILLVAIPVAIILILQGKATLLVLRDSLCDRSQRILQLALIWFLPLIGAIIVLAVHRTHGKGSGIYRTPLDAGDDYGFTNPGNRNGSHRFDDMTDND